MQAYWRWMAVASACAAVAACGKGGAGAGAGVEPKPAGSGSASGTSAGSGSGSSSGAAARLPGDIVRPPDKLPAGAVAIIGAPALSSPSFIRDVALSSHGQLLTCGDEYARLWDVGAGRLLWSRRMSSGEVRCALSPDGARVAVASKGKSGSTDIAIHDWRAGTEVAGGSSGSVPWFGLDPASFVAARGGVELRDTASNKTTRKAPIPGIAGGVTADGALIAVGRTQIVRVKSDGASEPVATLPSTIEVAVVSADGSRVAWTTGKQTGTVDVATGAVAALPDPGGKVEQLALSAKGDLLAVGIEGGLSVWEVATGKRLWGVTPKNRGLSPAVGFSPDAKRLAFAGTGRATVADARTGDAPPPPPRHGFAGWTPAGAAIVAASTGGRFALDLQTFAATESVEAAAEPANRPAWARNIVRGDGVVMAHGDGQLEACGPLKVWIEGQGERTLAKPRGCDEDAAATVWFVGPGIAVANTASPEVWDVAATRKLFDLEFGLRPLVTAQVSRDGKRLLLVLGPAPAPEEDADAYSDKEPRSGTRFELWSITDKKRLGALRVDKEGVTAAMLGGDGSRAYLGWEDGTVASLDTAAMATPTRIGGHGTRIESLSASPSGALVAATDADGSTTVWRP